MRQRGSCFTAWEDHRLYAVVHAETLDDGTEIDVRARIARSGATEMFLSVYEGDGRMLAEESYADLPGASVGKALAMGAQRAREIATRSMTQTRITVTE
ncbi:hypothetical protein [Pseudomonas sp.]|uniref:hypothetical protein n=1 Tax=Pseudomonas sp. TaxID=306 RepID=UPI00258FE4A6|nr:hypothetical protein [Pseudomonas sp.]